MRVIFLNDTKMPFYVKFVFFVGLTTFLCLAFDDSYIKANKDNPTWSATEIHQFPAE